MAKELIADKKYRDLDLNFVPHPNTGDIVPLKGVDAVRRSVKNIVLTNFYERPFKPLLGANVVALLFENNTPHTQHILVDHIQNAIRRYEPRATVLDVGVKSNENVGPFDTNYLEVTIQFYVNDLPGSVEEITMILERVR